MKKQKIVFVSIAVLLLVVVLGYIVIVGGGATRAPGDNISSFLLPDSPLQVTYRLSGQEFRLQDGSVETEGTTVKVVHGPVHGNISGNNDNADAVLVLEENKQDGTPVLYVVAALKTDNGYIGTEGIALNDFSVSTVEVRDEVIMIRGAGEQASTTKYFTEFGAKLLEVGPTEDGEQVMSGMLLYENDIPTYVACDGNKFSLADTSHSLVALKAIYIERAGSITARTPVYVVLVGEDIVFAEDEGATSSEYVLEVKSILRAPKEGMCAIEDEQPEEDRQEQEAEQASSTDNPFIR